MMKKIIPGFFFLELVVAIVALVIMAMLLKAPEHDTVMYHVIYLAGDFVMMFSIARLFKNKIGPVVQNETTAMTKYVHDEIFTNLDESIAEKSWRMIHGEATKTARIGVNLISVFMAVLFFQIVFNTFDSTVKGMQIQDIGTQVVEICIVTFRSIFLTFFVVYMLKFALVPIMNLAIAKYMIENMKKVAWRE